MNSLDWFAQLLLAGIFVFSGLSKIFAIQRRVKTTAHTSLSCTCSGMPCNVVLAIALVELTGALALIVPFNLWQPGILPLLGAAGLALLTLCACIYHLRRHESAAPIVALFLLTLFVIIGRWPQ